jgi:predicted P-loop ATPase/GTPase
MPSDAADNKRRPQNFTLDAFILIIDGIIIGPFYPIKGMSSWLQADGLRGGADKGFTYLA